MTSLKHRMTITRIPTSMLAKAPDRRLRDLSEEILKRVEAKTADRHVEEDLCWIQREVQNRASAEG